MQTPEQVVDAALRGVKGGKRRVISGLANKVSAYGASILPNTLITKTIGRFLKDRFGKKQVADGQ
jgi:short-subunit dehydrogenase